MVDVGEVVSAVLPYVTRTAAAYGSAVVQRVSDQASDATADATVGLGRRLLRRLFGSSRSVQVREAVTEVGQRSDDPALVEVLGAQLRVALAADPQLASDVVRLLAQAGVDGGRFQVMVSGGQGVQVGDHNTQTNSFLPPQS